MCLLYAALRTFAHVGGGDGPALLADEACVSLWHEGIIMHEINEFYEVKFGELVVGMRSICL